MSGPQPIATTRRPRAVAGCLLVVVLSMSATLAHAQTAPPDLSKVSLEDLMNVEVVSASRKEQRAADVASAIYVITQDDIRRSGLTSVPELLRLAPGVQVARIDASKWAVTIRGSNHRFSSKLLVLIDGRSVYARSFSGVYWDTLDVSVGDIDRIEVVRGPGGAIWGANAVNGVINIITKSSVDTTGALVSATVGTNDARGIAARYGAKVGELSYRAYLNSAQHAHTNLDRSTAANDDWTTLNGGMRLDWAQGNDRLMLRTDIVKTDANYLFAFAEGLNAPATGWPTVLQSTDLLRGSVLGRWVRSGANGRSLEVQGFIDASDREEHYQHYRSTNYDGDVKYHAPFGRHDVVTGIGFRESHERVDGTFIVGYTPPAATLRVFNVFAQDEIRLAGDRVRLTVGAKVEHDTYADWGVQPTARVLVAATPRQRVWAAVSRALRTPSASDRGVRVNFTTFPGETGLPVVVGIFGNPDYETEETLSLEGGYRVEARHLSVDVSTFVSDHKGLPTLEPLAPRVEFTYGQPNVLVGSQLTNLMSATASGAEIAARWSSAAWWRVDGSYTFFRFSPKVDPISLDSDAANDDGNAPGHQWSIRPALSLGPRVDINAMVLHVSRLKLVEVPAYTRTDLRIEWKVDAHWSLALTGQNLFGKPHAEFAGLENVTATTLVPRQIDGRLTWKF